MADSLVLDLFAELPPEPVVALCAHGVRVDDGCQECRALEPPRPVRLAEPEAAWTADQSALFDLAALRVAVPGEDIQAALEARMVTPASKLAGEYNRTTLRQVKFVFPLAQWRVLRGRMQRAAAQLGTPTNAELFCRLLTTWEQAHGLPDIAGPDGAAEAAGPVVGGLPDAED